MNNDIKEKIKELVDLLNKWNIEYFQNDNPSVSDRVYDSYLKKLEELENKFPSLILPNSPTQKIGSSINNKNKFEKIKHKKPMLSLDKAYSIDEIEKFINNIKKTTLNEPISFLIEPKIDGLSIALFYENGKLAKAVTRGDGEVGEDVTRNIKNIIDDIPTKIDYFKNLEVRGEVFITKSRFQHINKLENYKFANPRNLASGTLRQLDIEIIKKRKLSSFIYEVIDHEKHNILSQNESLNLLVKLGFSVFKNYIIVNNIEEIEKFINDFVLIKNDLDYEVDGLVIKLNDVNFYNFIGYTSKFPKYNIAFKFDDEVTQTTLDNIFITIGRTGVVTYNATLKTVLLKGTMVSAATLHNYNYIKDLNINIGDEVFIKKAGEIIPKVISLAKKKSNGVFAKILNCPYCNSLLIDSKTNINQMCINPNCDEINIKKITHFASRDAMNIEGLGEGIVRKFFEFGFLKKIQDIYDLERHREKIIEQRGFGDKFWTNLNKGIIESKKTNLEKVIFALGIPQLGSKNAKVIAKEIKVFENIINYDFNQLSKINDIGPITIQEIYNFFNKKENIDLVKSLVLLGINPKIKTKITNPDNFFFNKIFVITGTLSLPRNNVIEIIEKNGGKISSNISNKTNYLICGENSGSKKNKALKLNIEIINNEQLKEIINKL